MRAFRPLIVVVIQTSAAVAEMISLPVCHILQAVIYTTYMRLNNTLRWRSASRVLSKQLRQGRLATSQCATPCHSSRRDPRGTQPGHAANANDLMSKHPHLCGSQNHQPQRTENSRICKQERQCTLLDLGWFREAHVVDALQQIWMPVHDGRMRTRVADRSGSILTNRALRRSSRCRVGSWDPPADLQA